ncbi:MAG: hypothetical protein RML15_07905 [Bacteroidota bacterium]|nr:hypothetical protein [Candidatus Kapabacteria bacterium]MDW8272312.1 hypothetical protein [Bacteroidota bacterium]
MPGRKKAVSSGRSLEEEVIAIARKLGLSVQRQVRAGHRLWGRKRLIDVVLFDTRSGKSLGIECKAQETAGTTEEKLPATIHDIEAWPIPGIVVLSGKGFSEQMKSFAFSTGKAVLLEELEDWLRLYFGLYEDRQHHFS